MEEKRIGRVCLAHRGRYIVLTETGETEARLSGKFLYTALDGADFPVTGDLVALDAASRIDAVLPRKSRFSRKQAGAETGEQVLAANIDVLFLVSGLDGDFSPRRIERYLVAARQGGAAPAIVLNKADLCADPEARVREVRARAGAVPVLAVSATTGTGIPALAASVGAGRTAALAGSSGVGKSSIVNRLLGRDAQDVQAVREHDSRGRHTTVRRELIAMPGGWFLLDMPGLRELALWTDADAVDRSFEDIAAAAASCRFRDCRHQGEPGCAVAGTVDPDRLRNYTRLRHEAGALDRKRRDKLIRKAVRRLPDRWRDG